MNTSIRDLLGEVSQLQLAQAAVGGPDVAFSARQTIGLAAAALRQLRQWRPDWHPEVPARKLTEAFETACAAVGDGNLSDQLSKPAQLLAASADAIGSLCGSSTPAADRWAVTTAIADVVRRSTAIYAEHGPTLPDRPVQDAGKLAVAIARAGRRLAPSITRCVLDLPIPTAVDLLPDPLSRAAHAATEIDYTLTRAATDERLPIVSVYELRALSSAFQAAVRLSGEALATPSTEAERSWATVRQLARSLVDGDRPTPGGPEQLLRHAAQLHDSLLRYRAGGEIRPEDSVALQEIVCHAAGSAASLIDHADRMAGRVYSRADQFPVAESRVSEHLRRQPFILNRSDLSVLIDALHAAEAASAAMTTAAADIGTLGDYLTTVSFELPPPLNQTVGPPTF